MTVAIHAKDLFYLYRVPPGEVPALRGLSLDVNEGEVVSVLGPSGAGKSTLLTLCAGFARPSSGELLVLGHSATEPPRALALLRRSRIGIVRQHYHLALPRDIRVEEIVALPLRLLGRWGGAERRRVSELLRRAGLQRQARSYPGELSGGEQQRVAVCAALAKGPKLLLADEPTGELDSHTSVQLVEVLGELAKEADAAALIVTHDPIVAGRTERTIHIRDGRLAAEGATTPVLILDEHGWLRLPRLLREQAGLQSRVVAQASWGRVEIRPADAPRPSGDLSRGDDDERTPPAGRQDPPEVVLDHVTKAYTQGPPVLSDLSWRFEPEVLHVIAGPSGSGKTTLLNVIAGLEHLDYGQILVGGERIDEIRGDEAARWRGRVLGYVSQHSTLVGFLSAKENVEVALAVRGIGSAEAGTLAERWLKWVGLGEITDRKADNLSGGEQRRVALARALAPGPSVLLADEPTAFLDRISGRMVIRLLQRVARSGATVIAASHDPDVIAAADAVVPLSPLPGDRRSAPWQGSSSPSKWGGQEDSLS